MSSRCLSVRRQIQSLHVKAHSCLFPLAGSPCERWRFADAAKADERLRRVAVGYYGFVRVRFVLLPFSVRDYRPGHFKVKELATATQTRIVFVCSSKNVLRTDSSGEGNYFVKCLKRFRRSAPSNHCSLQQRFQRYRMQHRHKRGPATRCSDATAGDSTAGCVPAGLAQTGSPMPHQCYRDTPKEGTILDVR